MFRKGQNVFIDNAEVLFFMGERYTGRAVFKRYNLANNNLCYVWIHGEEHMFFARHIRPAGNILNK